MKTDVTTEEPQPKVDLPKITRLEARILSAAEIRAQYEMIRMACESIFADNGRTVRVASIMADITAGRCYVAGMYSGKVLAGYALLEVINNPWTGKDLHISGMHIYPRIEIAAWRSVMDLLFDVARHHKCNRIMAQVLNSEAETLAKAMGFTCSSKNMALSVPALEVSNA